MNDMSNCPGTATLNALLQDRLRPDQETQVMQHLEACARCQQVLGRLDEEGIRSVSFAKHLQGARAQADTALLEVIDNLRATKCGSSADRIGSDSLHFLAPSDDPASLGRLERYEISEALGQGGMGMVLKGYDPKLKRVVAIKVLSPQLATNAAARQRFRREAQAVAAVTHDHVVTVHGVDEADGLPYLVMEFVSGQSLQTRLDRNGSLELKEIVRIGMQTAAGLEAARAQGVVHRDIKPANILLENGVERVKITDFGLARAVNDIRVTRPGVVTGTPEYMSPEQARGGSVDHRSDLFSLGCMLYCMCAGRPPFRAESIVAIIRRVCEDQPRPLQEINPDVPDFLAALIEKLLVKHPDERLQSAAEVSELLGQYLAHLQDRAAHPRPPKLPGTPHKKAVTRSTRESKLRRKWLVTATVLLASVLGLGLAESNGLTDFVGTVVRFVQDEGVLVLDVRHPDVAVRIDGDGPAIIGVGAKEIHLPTGTHEIQATKEGRIVHRELVSIPRGDREVVRVEVERATQARNTSVVWDDTPDFTFSGKPSANGRYFSFADWASGNLGLRDLDTGKIRWLTQVDDGQRQRAWHSVISPDSKRIAYAWYDGASWELRIRSLQKDAKVQTLVRDWVVPTAWSADGDSIAAFITREDAEPQIALVSVADGAVKTLLPYDGKQKQPWMSFSPDGEYLACTLPRHGGGKPEDVVLLTTDGSGKTVPVTDNPANDVLMGWEPAGNRLVFASDRTGTMHAYSIVVSDGQPRSPPKMLTQIGEFTPIGFSSDGAYYFGRQLPRDDIYTARINADTGKVLREPEKAIRQHQGRS